MAARPSVLGGMHISKQIVVILLEFLAATAVLCSERLLQQAAGGCQAHIPACASLRCTTRKINNNLTHVCRRCLPGYVPAKATDGRSTVQCVCPPGTYQVLSRNSRACQKCPIGSVCPGGNRHARLATDNIGGNLQPCNPSNTSGLTTQSQGSSRLTDCVAQAGFVLPATKDGPAQPCEGNSYAPAFNRQRRCTPCPKGLAAPDEFTGIRGSKDTVCHIPPGKYLVDEKVLDCPVGTYRPFYVKASDQASRGCQQCVSGWTTASSGAAAAHMCNVLLPGYQMPDRGSSGIDAQSPGLTEAVPCPIGFYSTGGNATCTRCPYSATTRQNGSASLEECVVPPGYFVRLTDNGQGEMAKCFSTPEGSNAEGYYRPGWVAYKLVTSNNRARDGKDVCRKCGTGVLSSATELDELPEAPEGSKVAATSASCYIRSGWGVINSSLTLDQIRSPDQITTTLEAVIPCPADTYGAGSDIFGLQHMPSCTSCGWNLTSGPGSTGFENCINPAGYGYSATEGAYPCPLGSWATAGSMQACQTCPSGRITTAWAAGSSIDDCQVPPGFGVYSTLETDANPWIPETPTPDMPARPCPVGFYSAGDIAGGKTSNPRCQACVGGSTTNDTGSSSCDACIAGYGRPVGADTCTPCPYGSYNPGGQASCTQCPPTTYENILMSRLGDNSSSGGSFSSYGITFKTSLTGSDRCVPRYAQLPATAGTTLALPAAMFTVDVSLENQVLTENNGENMGDATVESCLEACPAEACCIAEITRNPNGSHSCRQALLTPVQPSISDGRARLFYKLPSSTPGSQDYQTLPDSVTFAVCDIHAWRAEALSGKVGKSLPHTLPPGSQDGAIEWNVASCMTVDTCKQACMMLDSCWGFIWVPDVRSKTRLPGGFALRGGGSQSSLAVGAASSTFFASPDGNRVSSYTERESAGLSIGNLQW